MTPRERGYFFGISDPVFNPLADQPAALRTLWLFSARSQFNIFEMDIWERFFRTIVLQLTRRCGWYFASAAAYPFAATDQEPQAMPPFSNRWGSDFDPQGRQSPADAGETLNVGRRPLDQYYVYQDLINKRRVRIHAGECSHCNNGCAQLCASSRPAGKWHGPLAYDQVFKVAGGLARPDTRTCRHCMP